MAKIKPFTDNSGVEHPECYWRLVQINIDAANETASFTFLGYADEEKREAKKQPIPGAMKQYFVSGADFQTYYAKHIAKQLNLAEVGYLIAMNTKDVPSGFDTQTGKVINDSFFKDAEDA